MARLANIYDSIIPVPNSQDRLDYLSGRMLGLRKIHRELKSGHLVALAPQGDWGNKPVQEGAAQIAIDTCNKYGGIVLPVGLGEGAVKIREPMILRTDDKKIVAQQIPEELNNLKS